MDFFTYTTSDGLRLHGLRSIADHEVCFVLHVHGYGGDFYSNAFVRHLHDTLPRRGISFASAALRTSGYANEVYDEGKVTYTGSALSNHDLVVDDIVRAVAALGVNSERLVIQGHSFGTNTVKRLARLHPYVRRIVLLSPADSVGLYHLWQGRTRGEHGDTSGADRRAIVWNLFGISVEDVNYPLPISPEAFDLLMRGEVFREWSTELPTSPMCLVVQGAADPISNYGTTSDVGFLKRALPNCEIRRIRGAYHGFVGHENELGATIAEWLERDL